MLTALSLPKTDDFVYSPISVSRSNSSSHALIVDSKPVISCLLYSRSCEAPNTGSDEQKFLSVATPRENKIGKRERTSDDPLKNPFVYRLSRSNLRRPAIVRGDCYQLGMFHVPQRRLLSLEWEIYQRVVVWNLNVSQSGWKG